MVKVIISHTKSRKKNTEEKAYSCQVILIFFILKQNKKLI